MLPYYKLGCKGHDTPGWCPGVSFCGPGCSGVSRTVGTRWPLLAALRLTEQVELAASPSVREITLTAAQLSESATDGERSETVISTNSAILCRFSLFFAGDREWLYSGKNNLCIIATISTPVVLSLPGPLFECSYILAPPRNMEGYYLSVSGRTGCSLMFRCSFFVRDTINVRRRNTQLSLPLVL